jgi:BirA family biotin operon repressor/biotin-[acetyl-CoA-carboxylase] ligase
LFDRYPSAAQLQSATGLPRVELFDSVGSTLDIAHDLGSKGTPSGTLILADAQTMGRGQRGRSWASEPGRGIWLTLVERPQDRPAIDVLSLRVGLAIAESLEPLIGETLALKWPNDIYRGGRKLAGVLVEARWRGLDLDWLAIGVGLNVVTPTGQAEATGIEGTGVDRTAVLLAIVPAIRRAAHRTGRLTDDELRGFAQRDLAAGRMILEPVRGRVDGLDASGALRVSTESGIVQIQAGSLVFQPQS